MTAVDIAMKSWKAYYCKGGKGAYLHIDTYMTWALIGNGRLFDGKNDIQWERR